MKNRVSNIEGVKNTLAVILKRSSSDFLSLDFILLIIGKNVDLNEPNKLGRYIAISKPI